MPYKYKVVIKLFDEIASIYVNRAGGYTRMIPLARRISDIAQIVRLEWVV